MYDVYADWFESGKSGETITVLLTLLDCSCSAAGIRLVPYLNSNTNTSGPGWLNEYEYEYKSPLGYKTNRIRSEQHPSFGRLVALGVAVVLVVGHAKQRHV